MNSPRRGPPLPVGPARLIVGNCAPILTAQRAAAAMTSSTPKWRPLLDLVHELLARFVAFQTVGGGDRLVAVEPVERLEIRVDRRNVARRDRPGPRVALRSQMIQLQLGDRPAVDRPLPRLFGDDLPDAVSCSRLSPLAISS